MGHGSFFSMNSHHSSCPLFLRTQLTVTARSRHITAPGIREHGIRSNLSSIDSIKCLIGNRNAREEPFATPRFRKVYPGWGSNIKCTLPASVYASSLAHSTQKTISCTPNIINVSLRGAKRREDILAELKGMYHREGTGLRSLRKPGSFH